MKIAFLLVILLSSTGVFAKTMDCGVLEADLVKILAGENEYNQEINVKFPSVVDGHGFLGVYVSHGIKPEFGAEVLTWKLDDGVHDAFTTVNKPHKAIDLKASYRRGASG